MAKLSRSAVISSSVLLLSIFLTACNGSSPTEPKGNYSLVIVGSFTQTSYQSTMRRVQLRLDDQVIREYSSNGSFYDIMLSGTAQAKGGDHRLELRVVEQTSSPNSYRVNATINVIDSSGRQVKEFNFPEKTVSLSSGQGVTYTFSI